MNVLLKTSYIFGDFCNTEQNTVHYRMNKSCKKKQYCNKNFENHTNHVYRAS